MAKSKNGIAAGVYVKLTPEQSAQVAKIVAGMAIKPSTSAVLQAAIAAGLKSMVK